MPELKQDAQIISKLARIHTEEYSCFGKEEKNYGTFIYKYIYIHIWTLIKLVQAILHNLNRIIIAIYLAAFLNTRI